MASNSTKLGVSRDLLSDRQRVAVTPAAEMPRIQFSSGAARALQKFSADLFTSSQRIEDRLDQQAAAEASVEGATAGATGDLELRDYSTIRGRAYNQAGIQTFVSTLETRSIEQFFALQQQYAGDPDGLRKALSDYHEGVAQEIARIDPGAAQSYRQRSTLRSLPAVEAARDTAFKMTREQADAALIQSQVALEAEMKTHSAHLFSDNPELSRAASSAVGLVVSEQMRVYDAIDPATGKPLYSPTEKAKARIALQEKIFTNATKAWFAGQEDKAGAYLAFLSGDFKFALDMTPADVNIIDGTQGKIRDKPISPEVRNKLSSAVHALGPGYEVMVVSGGQDAAGPGAKRTGSTRHDHGGAGDVVLVVDGKPVRPDEDPALYERFLENAAAAGFSGIGHYPGFVHVGGGTQAAWGPDKTSGSLDPTYAAAIERGRQNPMDTSGASSSVDVNKLMGSAAVKALESEMRAQIRFENEQSDRQDRQDEKAEKDAQAQKNFDLTLRLLNGGQEVGGVVMPELTREDVLIAVDGRRISPDMGRAFLEALNSDAPSQTDLTVYDEALRRMEAGEDVTAFVIQNKGNLTQAHAAKLIDENRRRIADPDDDKLTEAQRSYLGEVKRTIAPEGLLADLDQGATMRAFNAYDEARKRMIEGEDPSAVARDVIERAQREDIAIERSKTQKLLKPRHAVPGAVPGTIDVNASALALKAAFDARTISEGSYHRQRKLIVEWARTQGDNK